MPRFLLFLPGALVARLPLTAWAQGLTFDQLTPLLELPVSLAPAQVPVPVLREWVFHPTSLPPDAEPLTWGWWPPSADAASAPEALLSLRPNHGVLDVVLWLRRAGNYHQLRRELERRRLVPVAVTCLGCEGARYTTPQYTAAFYSGKPGTYPLVVVLHAAAVSHPAPGPASALPAARR